MSTKKKKKTSSSRKGTGAHGSRGRPAVDQRPKWRGGGTKGENEQTAH